MISSLKATTLRLRAYTQEDSCQDKSACCGQARSHSQVSLLPEQHLDFKLVFSALTMVLPIGVCENCAENIALNFRCGWMTINRWLSFHHPFQIRVSFTILSRIEAYRSLMKSAGTQVAGRAESSRTLIIIEKY